MPVLTQLNLNIGTEQNPNMVLHDLHDIRISSTDVNTVTRLLGCDAGVNSIAPITLANAASLLGGVNVNVSSTEDLDTKLNLGITYVWASPAPSNAPFVYGNMINVARSSNGVLFQVAFYRSTTTKISVRCYDAQNGVFGNWLPVLQ